MCYWASSIRGDTGPECQAGSVPQRHQLAGGKPCRRALMTALGYLFLFRSGPLDQGGMVSYQLVEKALAGFSYWDAKGAACFAGFEVLAAEDPPAGAMDGLRALVSPGCWSVACRLLKGPAQREALLEAGLTDTPESLTEVLQELIDAGLVIQDREGYRLDENHGLLLAGMVKALCLLVLSAPPRSASRESRHVERAPGIPPASLGCAGIHHIRARYRACAAQPSSSRRYTSG